MNNSELKREFNLSEEETEYLNSLKLPWETIRDNSNMWLLVHNYPIPKGYNIETATAAIQIPGSYPTAPLDMVYFKPALLRIDGKVIPATNYMINIKGLQFQRWSRHRTIKNPWRVGIDNISTQLSLVEEWLKREFTLR